MVAAASPSAESVTTTCRVRSEPIGECVMRGPWRSEEPEAPSDQVHSQRYGGVPPKAAQVTTGPSPSA